MILKQAILNYFSKNQPQWILKQAIFNYILVIIQPQ